MVCMTPINRLQSTTAKRVACLWVNHKNIWMDICRERDTLCIIVTVTAPWKIWERYFGNLWMGRKTNVDTEARRRLNKVIAWGYNWTNIASGLVFRYSTHKPEASILFYLSHRIPIQTFKFDINSRTWNFSLRPLAVKSIEILVPHKTKQNVSSFLRDSYALRARISERRNWQ